MFLLIFMSGFIVHIWASEYKQLIWYHEHNNVIYKSRKILHKGKVYTDGPVHHSI